MSSITLDHYPPASDLAAFRATLPQRLRVSIATPIDDGHKFCYWQSLLSLATARTGHDFRLALFPGDSLIPRARDNMNHLFYFGTADDYNFFVDSDIDFRIEDILQIVDRRLPLCAGLYAIKEEKLRWCMNTIKDEPADPATGLQKVATAGTGFFCYHRSVVARLIAAAPQWPHWKVRYIDDAHRDERYHLFADEVIDDPEEFTHSPRRMSEDWSFCYFARKLGYDVWMDTKVITLHDGGIKYPLNTRRLTEQEVKAG